MRLIIGNRNYSSWSLRGWLFLREPGLDFEVERVPLFTEGFRERILPYNPTGRVPALVDGEVRVWDSLAILDHVRAHHGVTFGWPDDPVLSGIARSVSMEMHAGFLGVRSELPMNIRARVPNRMASVSEKTRAEVDRIRTIWSDALSRSGGPFLFGDFGIADVMYAPVTSRFTTYQVPLADALAGYVERVLARDSLVEWCEAARAETEHLDFIDALAEDTPLRPG